MEEKEKLPQKASVADFLANERTFLSWVRTSIALMGLLLIYLWPTK